MSKQINKTVQFLAMVLVLVLSLAGPVYAVDGVIEINQARAEAGGVTTGDTPGFPVMISESGSYRLTGNLSAPDNTAAIVVGAETSDVTIDLNGFVSGGDVLENSYNFNITVVNGTVKGSVCLNNYNSHTSRVENVDADGRIDVNFGSSVIGCKAQSIMTSFGCIVTDNIVVGGQKGIFIASGTVTGNVVSNCDDYGISAQAGSTVTGNLVRGCDGFGLKLGTDTGYANNVLTENNGGSANPQVDGGIEMGTNVCGNDTTCP